MNRLNDLVDRFEYEGLLRSSGRELSSSTQQTELILDQLIIRRGGVIVCLLMSDGGST